MSERVVSWNVNGLNTPDKRSIVLREVYRLRAGICFIQETHFRKDAIPRFQAQRYPQVYHSCSSESKSKVVSILIGQKVPWTTKDVWVDVEGRMLFIKDTLGEQPCTLASVYMPNSAQVSFIEGALEMLHEFAEGMLVLGGVTGI